MVDRSHRIIRPIPDDFVQNRARMTWRALQAHYGAGSRTLGRWIKELGLPAKANLPPPKPRLTLPADFAELAPSMSKTSLGEYFNASQKVIERWLCEAGVSAKPRPPVGKMALQGWASDIPPPRRESPEDIAADYLRKWQPVSRHSDGKMWFVGRLVLTSQELIDKAEAKRNREARK